MLDRLASWFTAIGLSADLARVLALLALVAAAAFLLRAAVGWLSLFARAAASPRVDGRRAARQRARQALRTGDLTSAAESLEMAGDPAAALEVRLRAAEEARRRGDVLRAAQHLEAAGRTEDAGRLLLSRGRWPDARDLFRRAGLPEEEARALEKGGRLDEAALVWDRAGRAKDALRCLERAASKDAPPELVPRREEMALKAAALCRRLGRPDRAAALLEEAGLVAAAARCHAEAGAHARAAALFERSGELVEAAACHDRAGDRPASLRCRGRARLAAGDAPAAADLFREAGDVEGLAAAAEAAGRHVEAAGCRERLGQLAEAARLFLASGRHDAAASCFERAGLLVEAAREYERAGRMDRALHCLQAVPAGTAEAHEARGRIGTLLFQRGDVAAARDVLADLVQEAGATSPPEQVAGWLGDLARCHERLGSPRKAVDVARRATAVNPRDVAAQALVARLERAAGQESLGGAPDRYDLLRPLATGGMGYVHLARDTLLDRLVALKVLSERWRDRPELCERFLREARIAARLTHPHVVAIYDVGEHDGRPFMALEYVAGRDLRELLQDRGRLPLAEAVPILSAVAEALAAAHERGIVHRDVKPGNVFLGDDGVVKVGDFGIARLADGEATSGGLRFATPQFVAPEQVVGDEATVASDIYSLGATAFAVLCGRPPFVGKDAAWQQVHEAPPDPRALAPDLPEAVAALLLRSLSKVPAQRPQSSRDFAAELQAAACATIPPG